MVTRCVRDFAIIVTCESTHVYPVPIPPAPGNSISLAQVPNHIQAPSSHVTGNRGDAPWAGIARWLVSADPPHDVTRSSQGYHLRSSPSGRNLDQFCALVYSIYDDDSQDDRTPTSGQSWERSPGWSYSDLQDGYDCRLQCLSVV